MEMVSVCHWYWCFLVLTGLVTLLTDCSIAWAVTPMPSILVSGFQSRYIMLPCENGISCEEIHTQMKGDKLMDRDRIRHTDLVSRRKRKNKIHTQKVRYLLKN